MRVPPSRVSCFTAPSFRSHHGRSPVPIPSLKEQFARLNPAALLMKLDEPKPLPPELKKFLATAPPPEEPPMPALTFVDVDPALAAEPPKDAKFYSAVSTRAANPDTKVESNVPKIDGKQEQFAKLTEVAKPLPPALPPPPDQDTLVYEAENKFLRAEIERRVAELRGETSS